MKTILITFFFLFLGLIVQAQTQLEVDGTAKVGLPGEGNVLLELNSERSWVFRQLNTGASTALELTAANSNNANKSFVINTNGRFHVTHLDTITNSTENVVRRTDGSFAVRQYKIGDYVHGGIVFWVDGSGEHGLVCARSDQGTNVEWGPDNITGAIRDNIYGGMMNTERIIIDQGTNSFAADLCAQYGGGGYGDWYLPSKEEFSLITQNKNIIDAAAISNGGSAFAFDWYWCSTEFNASRALSYTFEFAGFANHSKDNPENVRAVRAF